MSMLTRHFSLGEFACRDGCRVPDLLVANVQRLAEQLEVLRRFIGNRPIVILSGYRTPAHNATVSGKEHSQHLLAKAADIRVAEMYPDDIHAAIQSCILRGRMADGGVGLYSANENRRGFVHYDIGRAGRRWAG